MDDGVYEDQFDHGEEVQVEHDHDHEDEEEEYVYSDEGEGTDTKDEEPGRTFVVPDGAFKVITYKEVEPLMAALVREVSDLLAINQEVSQILLRQFKWNKERLLEVYYNNPDKVMVDAGLDLFSSNPQGADAAIVCRICGDEVGPNDAFGLGCGHNFCKDCYCQYLRVQISEGPQCVCATCPEHKCTQMVPYSAFKHLLGQEEFRRYSIYSLRNFIETSRNMRWCPAAGCEHVVLGSGIGTVRCQCGMPFCFRCGEEAHAPASCEQLMSWHEKCHNESETANWILAHTKKCPACKTRIEKNHGCNHMNCRVCKHEFCWICMGPWMDHGANTGGYYKCNRYDATAPTTEDSAASRAKAELDRYLHYYKGYAAHDQSLKFANQQRDQAEKRMVEMQETERSAWIDVQFLKNAVEQLIDCRRVLKYTYVLGFFLVDGSSEKELFEHNQSNLQKYTETLSDLTEKDFASISRTDVVNYTRVTERFMQGLLQSVHDGLISDNTNDPGVSAAVVAGSEEKSRV
jgi:ariadne-1